MSEVTADREDARLLQVRTVEIVSGRGTSLTLSSVRCPVRARSSTVEACAACGRGRGITQDALTRGEYLSCSCRAGDGAGAAGDETAVGEVMPRTAVALRPSVGRVAAADALRARGVPSAPVVDGDGRPIGLVSESDLLRARPGAKVADAMTLVALAVPEGASLVQAASLMAREGVERLAVVGPDGGVIGVLATGDVVAWLAGGAGHAAGQR